MHWKELIIYGAAEAEEPIANVLNEAGANGVVIEDIRDISKERPNQFGEIYDIDTSHYPRNGIRMRAYFTANSDWSEKKLALIQQIKGLADYQIDLGSLQILENTVQEKDWENNWKRYFKAQAVTEQFMIVPEWERDNSAYPRDGLTIYIDPGMAFGTGTHPTTILCLKALEKYVKQDDLVLDVGVGSGILGVAASLLGARHVYGYDLDEIAVKSAKMNRDINQLQDHITIQQHDLLKGIKKQANVIVSNILADILVHLLADAWDNLMEEGHLIMSGIIQEKRQMMVEALTEKGFSIVEITQDGHWISIIAKKGYDAACKDIL